MTERKRPDETTDQFIQRVGAPKRAAESRAAQGLPPKITDPAILRRVVAILRRPANRTDT